MATMSTRTRNPQMERSTIEAYAGGAIGVVIAVIPMTWYFQTGLFSFLGLLAADIAYRAPWFIHWSIRNKIFLWLISAGLLAAIGWNPIHEQYIKDHQVLSTGEVQRFGQSLIDLSSDVQSYAQDLRSQSPPSHIEGSDPHADWQRGTNYDIEADRKIQERFSPRIIAALSELRALGVVPPDFILAGTAMRLQSSAKWVGAMGRMLSDGKLKEAIKVGSDKNLWWDLAVVGD